MKARRLCCSVTWLCWQRKLILSMAWLHRGQVMQLRQASTQKDRTSDSATPETSPYEDHEVRYYMKTHPNTHVKLLIGSRHENQPAFFVSGGGPERSPFSSLVAGRSPGGNWWRYTMPAHGRDAGVWPHLAKLSGSGPPASLSMSSKTISTPAWALRLQRSDQSFPIPSSGGAQIATSNPAS